MLTKSPVPPAFSIPSLGYIVVAWYRSRQALTVIGPLFKSHQNFFQDLNRNTDQKQVADHPDEFHRDSCVGRALLETTFVKPQRSGVIV